MKRLMFLLVSAFIATTSYCANVSDNIMYVLGNNDETTQIEKQILRVTIRIVLILLTARIVLTHLTIQIVTK